MYKYINILGLFFFIIIIGHIFKLSNAAQKSTIKFNGLRPEAYIVLKCVIPNQTDEGGFMWHLHHAQCLIHLSHLYNKIPLVYYNRGYYYSPEHGENWYDYYFEPITDPHLTKKVVYYGDVYGYTLIDNVTLPPSSLPYLYTNTTFQTIVRKLSINFNRCYRFIKLNPATRHKLESFKNKYFGNHYLIGIHYRGTDKYPSYNDNEDLRHPIHISYYRVVVKVREYINRHNLKNILIFVASDEESFVQTIKIHFPNVVSYNTSRSSINTSNVYLNSIKCVAGSKSKVCHKLKEMKEASIHRGNNEIAPFKKGEDVVMDTWLLASCKVFFRATAGNFSSQPKRINNDLIVVTLY